jgi:DNA-binding GntR family transcriptional regulator
MNSLAEMLNLGRASLYRAFDRLSADGYIRKEGRSIAILDREGMQQAYR